MMPPPLPALVTIFPLAPRKIPAAARLCPLSVGGVHKPVQQFDQ